MQSEDRDFHAVVFDLDGTLLDTLQDIAVAANATLAELGEPELDLQTYRGLVGEGVVSLLRRALGTGEADTAELSRAVERLEYHYGLNWNRHTRP